MNVANKQSMYVIDKKINYFNIKKLFVNYCNYYKYFRYKKFVLKGFFYSRFVVD